MAKGQKTGGRRKGVRNKSTVVLAQELADAGELPRDYMLRVMRDPDAPAERRDEMAKAAAPYVHAKLAAVEVTGAGGGPIQVTITGDDAGLL